MTVNPNGVETAEITYVLHGVTYVATPTGPHITPAGRQGTVYMINAISLKLPTFYITAGDFTGIGRAIEETLIRLDQDDEWAQACN